MIFKAWLFYSYLATGELVIVSRILNKRMLIGVYAIDPSNNKYTSKQFELDRMPGQVSDARIGALPSTNGKICIYFYNKTEKTITMYLEDMDLQQGFSSTK